MKTALGFLAIGATLLMAGKTLAGDISLNISGFATDAGKARIILMKDEAGYRGTTDIEEDIQVPIRNGKAIWNAKNIAPGNYALLAHHDIDADGDLNRPIFNLPLEPYGFSNGAWTSIGIPSWHNVAFTVGDKPVHQTIFLRMNAFAVFAQMAVVGVPSWAVIFMLLALFRLRRRRVQSV